jgi:hypothetical protein
MSAATPSRSVKIPEETAQGIERRIEHSGFANVDAFVAFVLARLLENPGEVPFSEEDERRLKDKLRSLGYID